MFPHTTRLPLLLVQGGASLLVIASALLGAMYGYIVGSHTNMIVGVIFGTAALAGEVLKPFAVAAALDAFGRWHFLRGAACALLAFVAVVYSVTSELGLAAASRGDHVAVRRAIHDDAQSIKAARDRAHAELSTLAPARDGLDAQIRTLRAMPGANGCEKIDGPISRDICRAVAELETEAARAKRRAELEAIVRAPAAAQEGQQVVQHADPLAAALAAYLTALGFAIGPDGLSPWLLLVPVLFLELGSALGVVVVRSMVASVPEYEPYDVSGPTAVGLSGSRGVEPVGPLSGAEQTPDAGKPLEPAISGDQQTPIADTKASPTDTKRRTPRAPEKRTRKRTSTKPAPRTPDGPGPRGGGRRRPDTNIVRLLQRNGGRLNGTQRGIAKSLGLSKSRTNELLRDLQSRGVVDMRTGRSGTVVSLAVA